MSKYIGGEFAIFKELLDGTGDVCKSQLINTGSGRSALYVILKNVERKFGVAGDILLPSYLCDSITRTVLAAGWKYQFYSLDNLLRFDKCQQLDFHCFKAILMINYFGLMDIRTDIEYLRKEAPHLVIIEDDVQAYFELDNSIADYSFNSLRKWFPCPDGGIIKSSSHIINTVEIVENKWSQYKLAGNLLKAYIEHLDESLVLRLLNEGERMLDIQYLSSYSNVSKIIYSNLDLKKIASNRIANAKVLHEGLVELGIKHMYNENSVPLFIPIFVENPDELRRDFFRKNIFTPRHWPKISDELNGCNILYEIELSLICDQRYDETDMIRQIEVLKEFKNSR